MPEVATPVLPAVVNSPTSPVGASASATDAPVASDEFVAALAQLLIAETSTPIAPAAPMTAAPLHATQRAQEDELAATDLAALVALLLEVQAPTPPPAMPASSAAQEAATTPTQTSQSVLQALQSAPALAEAQPVETESRQTESSDATSPTKTDFVTHLALATHERAGELRERAIVHAPVGTQTWNQELAGKLTMLVSRGVQNASLQLTPEHLGPLEVRISIQSDQVSVWFGAAHPDTRAALEQALPRLREMLAGQGLHLSDAGVFKEPPKHAAKHFATASYFAPEGEQEMSITIVHSRGILDAYA